MIPRPINIATVGELKTFFRQMADSTPLHLLVNGEHAKSASIEVDDVGCTIALSFPIVEPAAEPQPEAPPAA